MHISYLDFQNSRGDIPKNLVSMNFYFDTLEQNEEKLYKKDETFYDLFLFDCDLCWSNRSCK